MHEVIGHASGKIADRLNGKPQTALKEQYSALEEARADLVALYFLPDPKLVELGLVSAADHDEVVLAEYEAQTRNALVQLRRVRTGTQLEEDHMRNRQMIIHWLMKNTKAIDVAPARRQDVLRRDRCQGVPRRRRDAARRSAADQVGRRLSGRQAALRDLRRALRPEAARRGRRARRSPEPAVLHRVRDAEARGGQGRRRRDHRRDDLLPARPDAADARVLGGDQGASLERACADAGCGRHAPDARWPRRRSRALLRHLAFLRSAFLPGCAARPPRRSRATRLAILQAEERGATSARDLADHHEARRAAATCETVRMAVRALGRSSGPRRFPTSCCRSVTRCRKSASKPRMRSHRPHKASGPSRTRQRRDHGSVSAQAALIARLNVEDRRERPRRAVRGARTAALQERRRRRAGGDDDRRRLVDARHEHDRSPWRGQGPRGAASHAQRFGPAGGAQAIALLKIVDASGRHALGTGVAARRPRAPPRARGADERATRSTTMIRFAAVGSRSRRCGGWRCGPRRSAAPAWRTCPTACSTRSRSCGSRRCARCDRAADERTCDASLKSLGRFATWRSRSWRSISSSACGRVAGRGGGARTRRRRSVRARSAARLASQRPRARGAGRRRARSRGERARARTRAPRIWQVRMYAARAAAHR